MTPEHARAAAIKHCLEFACAPDPADGIATGRNPDTSCASNSATHSELPPVSHVCGGSRDGGFSGEAA